MISHPKRSNERVGKYFRSSEFDCSCDHCSHTFIDPELVELLDRMRDLTGAPIVITSAYRCDFKQNELRESGHKTANGRSTHQDGKAADIRCAGLNGIDLEYFADKAGFEAIGIAEKWIHVDTRKGRRRWPY